MDSRRQGTRKVVYPFLEQIALIAPDSWWQKTFRDYSKGALPKGVSLNGYIVGYAHMGDVVHYEISNNPAQAYKELCSFFVLHPKIAPTTIPLKNRDSTEASKSSVKAKSVSRRVFDRWNAIKGKNRRSALISKFVEMVEREYSLTSTQTCELRDILYFAQLEDILDDSIEMEDGLITSVSCVKFDGKTFQLSMTHEPSTRLIRIPPPPNTIYAKYPTKQLDPDLVIENHMKALRKQRANTTIVSASAMLPNEEDVATTV